MNVENAIVEHYTNGARERVEELCCPIDYDVSLLKILSQEVINRDYGCGDPLRYAQEGDVVLDLGSDSGRICYMAAQLVGKSWCVIGVDMNDDMLTMARKYQQEMTEKIGGNRVEFIKGHIQDLLLSTVVVHEYLTNNAITDTDSLSAFEQWKLEYQQSSPMIADNSVDLVIIKLCPESGE